MNPVDNYIMKLEMYGKSKEYIKSMSYVLKQFNDLCDQNKVDILDADEDTLYLFVKRLKQENKAESTLDLYLRSVVRFYEFIVKSEKYDLIKNTTENYLKQSNIKIVNHRRPAKSVQEIS